jgi:hypothetical protein
MPALERLRLEDREFMYSETLPQKAKRKRKRNATKNLKDKLYKSCSDERQIL